MAELDPESIESIPQNKLRQIRRLLDVAEHASTGEAERENAMARAMAMMAEHGVTEMMANAYGRKQVDEVIHVQIKVSNPYGRAKAYLASWIGRAMGCRSVLHTYGREYVSVSLVGFRSDAERAELLYTSLLLQMINGVKNVRPDWYDDTPTATYRANWMQGFGEMVHHRIHEAERAARAKFDTEHKAEQKASGAQSTAMVLVGRDELVKAKHAELFPRLDKVRASSRSSDSGRKDGQTAGRQADIGGTALTGGRKALGGR
ncbi:MAG TPA: DUF2786 domain-containing protein [Propionibacteriaceae bacterium]|jgi:hypothetical protein|nr:DUF2786 domain-containing protein [Propionibacteriaceae bacterium]